MALNRRMRNERVRGAVIALWLAAAFFGRPTTDASTSERSIHAPDVAAEVARPTEASTDAWQQRASDARGTRVAVAAEHVGGASSVALETVWSVPAPSDHRLAPPRERRLAFTHQATAPPASL